MLLLQRFFVGLCVCMFASCSHMHVVKKEKLHSAVLTKAEVAGSAYEPHGLSGEFALTPFKAGAQAEANDETDHISMMVLKGIKDSIDEQKNSIHVVDAAEGHPVIAMQGYIDEFSKTGKFSRIMMHPNRYSLSLSGEVWLISNGQRLLIFSAKKKFDPKKESVNDVAYQMGRGIGDFIGAHAK